MFMLVHFTSAFRSMKLFRYIYSHQLMASILYGMLFKIAAKITHLLHKCCWVRLAKFIYFIKHTPKSLSNRTLLYNDKNIARSCSYKLPNWWRMRCKCRKCRKTRISWSLEVETITSASGIGGGPKKLTVVSKTMSFRDTSSEKIGVREDIFSIKKRFKLAKINQINFLIMARFRLQMNN